MIIGLTGKNGSGKGVVAAFLKERGFIFHSLSDVIREEIKKQAKGIMDSFSKKLSTIKEKIPEPIIERENFERIEEINW